MISPSFLHLPYLAIAYVYPRLRQDQSWSYRQALANSLLKASLRNYTVLHMEWPLSLKPRRESQRFVLIEPADPPLYTGVLLDQEVEPERIGGTWYPDPYSSDAPLPEGRHVILHLHGGSYIMGDGRTASCQYLAGTLLDHTPADYLLCPQYRLAGRPNRRFPAQLQDAVSAYSYLIHTLRIPASRIVVSGDSSGGHLALALLRYIVEFDNRVLLPAPKCSLLWSPWCDVPAAINTGIWNHSSNYKTEYIPGCFPAWGAKRFLSNIEISETIRPYLAPIRHPFIVPSPVLVVTGDREVLFQEHEKLAEDFQALVKDESLVELFVEHRVPHDVLMVGWIMDFRAEARECAIKAGEFISQVPPRP
ncbi:Alpha/Beta hydrolase protein [Fusarium oxysporum f. sp. albedinis]|uniref:Alpha/beta hydrolase fold-3 domain-containing protein n=1 Tax=Fusarium oxysporum f. sp. narcissi TaxID=451672 RepID=A0A4Q2UWI0_FUSOX|nr:Alpha/Beta hydrolase protein [Fusarium oxysporum f. sp. albedinis]KAJ0128282.1 Uncharacterized protein HZ326_28626 [Fusarium oxysporum f. sp. albedinis]KAK2470081.1 hypothetical protein H9L39_18229 [Fusarium oxysporum f. sp. albedinis]RYC78402.1 hypothetical protein BFJ63_vAg18724 [Fusarium oxysporum f. sp. narcissi]